MAGNVNTASRTLSRIATRFQALFIRPRVVKQDTADLGQYAGYPLVTVQAASGQTADLAQFLKSDGTLLSRFDAAGCFGGLNVVRAKYDFAVDGGAQGAIVPKTGAKIPDNAIIVAVVVNSTTAVTSLGGATLAVGTSAGSSATALLGATAKATLSADALLSGVPVFNDATKWVKMTAAGSLNVTVGTADLTAGVVEITAFYVQASA